MRAATKGSSIGAADCPGDTRCALQACVKCLARVRRTASSPRGRMTPLTAVALPTTCTPRVHAKPHRNGGIGDRTSKRRAHSPVNTTHPPRRRRHLQREQRG